MAKDKTTTTKGSTHARTKALPQKKAPSNKTAPKKSPAPQHNSKNWKQAVDNSEDGSSGESSDEEQAPQPRKKRRGKLKELIDEDNDELDDVMMQVDEEGPQSDNKV